MQELIKSNVLIALGKGPGDVKDVLKTLKKIAGLEDINKSMVNKILYAFEKEGKLQRTAENPPEWSLKAGVSGESSSKSSPELIKAKVQVFRKPIHTIICDESTESGLEHLDEFDKETTQVIAFLEHDEFEEAVAIGSNAILRELPDSPYAVLVRFTMIITEIALVQKHKVTVVTSNQDLKEAVEWLKNEYKADVKVIAGPELEELITNKE